MERLSVLAAKVRALFGLLDADSDFDEEMRAHLELLVERYVRESIQTGRTSSLLRSQKGKS